MQVAILTIGDELLAGRTTNTNASWLAGKITDRGGAVRRILTIPDDRALIADVVAEWSERFDAVVVTGGLGGTPDDVTLEAVAAGLERDLAVVPSVKEQLLEKGRDLREERPEFFEEYDLEFDVDAAASLPEGARPIVIDDGWSPGCVIENVYVFAGIPDEMKAMFETVEAEFSGEVVSKTVFTPAPEGSLRTVLEGVDERFDVSVGSYPQSEDRLGRLRVTGSDEDTVEAAAEWLAEQVETREPPESN
ncbi:competence/damage-inducible protein A [Halostagnicola kamekurae]|uniref:Molybdenum cofactor synthesis domain-containing protein n=1 Tax=Halostagnicola kamekurae TaxID=619731 RepID=A0A1I6QFM9_9EURY|nr:molybdopterin-binding protein [Halostagnicola kamekurae]SFS51313.1 molybdenum cofactor synthesis domain-containing protein [Halostagnicola kamekurae]